MVALRARRFVCSAMDVMSLTTSPISRLEVPSRSMVAPASPAAATAVAAVLDASAVDVAISVMAAVICSPAAAHGADAGTDLLGGGGDHLRLRRRLLGPDDNWVATVVSSSLDAARLVALSVTSRITTDRDSKDASVAFARRPTSSRPS